MLPSFDAPDLSLRTTRVSLLNRWTLRVAVRTKDAAIAFERLEQRAATPALIEELAGVRRHQFALLVPALRAGDGRVFFH
jgi:hypothetical protein